MRLLNTSTDGFEEFIGTDIPAYAILSHTWGEGEVSYKDMTTDSSYKEKKGYEKIKMTCRIARQEGILYAWVDTCCIDKSSSAELTEAINSMFLWYEKSKQCYAYLADLDSTSDWHSGLAHCRWFTRGWTLQELIAPRDVWFYDKHWNYLCRKRREIHALESITSIHQDVLQNSGVIHTKSIAQRMSWASRRVTTRVEDEAYCLLGIFDVNMPMLYGEGRKAFQRLQGEIIRISTDLSIFAWKISVPSPSWARGAPVACSILASRATDFAESGNFLTVKLNSTNDFSISNRGIKFHTSLAWQQLQNAQGTRIVMEVCQSHVGYALGIRLRKSGDSQLVREDPWTLVEDVSKSYRTDRIRTMYVLTRMPPPHSSMCSLQDLVLRTRSQIFQIVLPPELYVSDVYTWSRWDETDQVFFVSDNLNLDYAGVRIYSTYRDSMGVEVKFNLMLYGWGWGGSHPTFTLVPWNSSPNIKEFNDMLEEGGNDRTAIEHNSKYFKIDVSLSARIPLANQKALQVDCTPQRVTDETKCRAPFWQLVLSMEEVQNLPLRESTSRRKIFNRRSRSKDIF